MIIGSSDGGPGAEEAPAGLADEIVAALPGSSEYLIWVDSPEGRAAAKLAKLEIGVLGNLGFKVRWGVGVEGGREGSHRPCGKVVPQVKPSDVYIFYVRTPVRQGGGICFCRPEAWRVFGVRGQLRSCNSELPLLPIFGFASF